MKLYFIRHGETEWNVKKKIQGKTDVPLNENGRKQARALAERLLKKQQNGFLHVKSVYTSPQLRAEDTAMAAAKLLEVPCIRLDGLREMDLGEWEGMNWERIEADYGETYYYWNGHRRYVHTPGGESYNDVLKRTLDALRVILDKEESDVLVVTHSAILMALRCYLAKLPFEEMVARFKTKNTELVEIDAEDILKAMVRFEAGE